MTTPQPSKQGAITREIRAALEGGKALSSSDIFPRCPSAGDRTELARVIYELRQNGTLEGVARPGGHKVWRITEAKSQAKPNPVPIPPTEAPMPVTTLPEPVTTKADATEFALADLVDQADEALLALADSLLSDHPVWAKLRRLADETHGALCDYRLMRTLAECHDSK